MIIHISKCSKYKTSKIVYLVNTGERKTDTLTIIIDIPFKNENQIKVA